MDEAERRQRAAGKRAARERYLREHWPERWAEQQERRRAEQQRYYANNRQAIRAPEDERQQARRGVRAREEPAGRTQEPRPEQRRLHATERGRRAPEHGEARARYLQEHWPQQWAELQAIEQGTRSWRQSEEALNRRAAATFARRARRAGREVEPVARAVRPAPVEQYKRRARMKQLTLPTPTARQTNDEARRTNESLANEFFGRNRTEAERTQLQAEAPTPTARARRQREQEAVAPPLRMMQRLGANVGGEQQRKRLAGELYEEWLFRRELPALIERWGARYEQGVLLEVQLDQAGRKLVGKAPLNEEREVPRRVEARVLQHHLTPEQQVILDRIRGRSVAQRQESLREIREHLAQAPAVQDLKRRLPGIVAKNSPFREPGIRHEVEVEQVARAQRGAKPLDVEHEVSQRVEQAVIRHDLSPRDRETLVTLRAARAQRKRSNVATEQHSAEATVESHQQRPEL